MLCCQVTVSNIDLTADAECIFLMSQVARASLQRNNDPLDAALFYLAMKKKAVVWGLYRYLSLPFNQACPLHRFLCFQNIQ